MPEQTKAIDKEILNKIKQIILDTANNYNIKINKIILFGSRARGDYNEYSDWDILIVTEDKLNKELETHFSYCVHRKLVDLLDSAIDLLIIDKEKFEERKNDIGYVYYWANKEGIVL
ncbi:nucleotidyltransferase [Nanoarchaeota archaeon]